MLQQHPFLRTSYLSLTILSKKCTITTAVAVKNHYRFFCFFLVTKLYRGTSEPPSDLALTGSCCCFEPLIDRIKKKKKYSTMGTEQLLLGKMEQVPVVKLHPLTICSIISLCFRCILSKLQKISLLIF